MNAEIVKELEIAKQAAYEAVARARADEKSALDRWNASDPGDPDDPTAQDLRDPALWDVYAAKSKVTDALERAWQAIVSAMKVVLPTVESMPAPADEAELPIRDWAGFKPVALIEED